MTNLRVLTSARRWVNILGKGLGLMVLGLSGPALAALPPATSSKLTAQQAERLSALERGWVANAGQWDKKAAFSAPGYFGTTWVSQDGKLLHVTSKQQDCPKPKTPKEDAAKPLKPCASQSWVLADRWVGGKVKAIRGEEELETKVSYFLGNDPAKHRSALPSYRYVSLGEVWPGVEVKLKATQKTVEKLFYLHPKADPSKVQIELQGAKALKLSPEGEILIETGLGELKLSKPVAWQEKEGKKLPVQVSYKLLGKQRYGFKVAKADPSLPLVIDPILQSTYLGGSGRDEAIALAIAPSGDVYVAGRTVSGDFPHTDSGAQASKGDLSDAFVARLNASLTSNLQSTYLGGNGDDEAWALAIAGSGDVYVAGTAGSDDLPHTSGGAQESYGGGYEDAFVARLDSTLTNPNFQATYLGGVGNDWATALAIGPAPSYEVYVAGGTDSIDFPNTTNGAQESQGGTLDAFVARLNAALTQNLQATYLGGSDLDRANALAIHPSTGEVYVAGYTWFTDLPHTSGGADFPHTSGGAQESYGGGYEDAFVARLDSTLTNPNFQATYLGGSDYDWANALAIAGNGDVYVAGGTWSTDFPHTSGGAQESKGSYEDAFVARLDSTLTNPNFQSTYLGGSNLDGANALAIAGNGDVYVAGGTWSTDFPHTSGGAQESYGSDYYSDAFVARLDSTLTNPNFQSTYLGGSDFDEATALAVHPATGEVYVAGDTGSDDFPHTSGGAQESKGGPRDAFVARLTADLLAVSFTLSISPPPTGGTVTSPSGIQCGSSGTSCSVSLSAGTSVTLTATPDPGYTFVGWGGDCSWTETTLTLLLDGDKVCEATFAQLLLDLTGAWSEVATWVDSRRGVIRGRGKLKVENRGSVNTPSAIEVKFYLSEDGTTPTRLLRTVTIAPLAAGEAKEIRIMFSSSTSVSGQYLLAVIDPADQIEEANEANNRPNFGPLP